MALYSNDPSSTSQYNQPLATLGERVQARVDRQRSEPKDAAAVAPGPSTAPGSPVDPGYISENIAGSVLYLNQRIRSGMLNDDYVAAAQAKDKRDALLATEQGAELVTSIRATMAALGDDSVRLGPEILTKVQQILPENLHAELKAYGRDLSVLENRTNEAFFMKTGVPRDDAQLMSRLFTFGQDRLNPDNPADAALHARASRMYKRWNQNPHDIAGLQADMDNFDSGLPGIQRALSGAGDGQPFPSPYTIHMAGQIFDAAEASGMSPSDAALLVREGREASRSQPGYDVDDLAHPTRFAGKYFAAHATAAKKAPDTYMRAYNAMRAHNFLSDAADPVLAAEGVASIAPSVAAMQDLGLGDEMLKIGYQQAAYKARLPGAQAPSTAALAQFTTALSGKLAMGAIRAGDTTDLSSGDAAAALVERLGSAQMGTIAGLTPRAEVGLRDLARGLKTEQQKAAMFIPTAEAQTKAEALRALTDETADPQELIKWARLYKDKPVEFEKVFGVPTGPEKDALLVIAGLPEAGNVGLKGAFNTATEAKESLVARFGGATGRVAQRRQARKVDDDLGRFARDVGAGLYDAFQAVGLSTTEEKLDKLLTDRKVTLGGKEYTLLQVLERSKAGQRHLDDLYGSSRIATTGAGKVVEATLGGVVDVLGEIGMAVGRGTAGAGAWLVGGVTGKKDASAYVRRDPLKYGRRITEALLREGSFSVEEGSLTLMPSADSSRMAPVGKVTLYDKEFSDLYTPEKVNEVIRFARSNFNKNVEEEYSKQTGGATALMRLRAGAAAIARIRDYEGELATAALSNSEIFDDASVVPEVDYDALAMLGLLSPFAETRIASERKASQDLKRQMLLEQIRATRGGNGAGSDKALPGINATLAGAWATVQNPQAPPEARKMAAATLARYAEAYPMRGGASVDAVTMAKEPAGLSPADMPQ